MSRPFLTFFSLLLAASLVLAACSSSAQGSTLTVVSSLPMTGASATASQAIVNAERLKLDQINGQVCQGRYRLTYQALDDALPATGQWDPAIETAHANEAAADRTVIAYLGTLNSGATEQSIPVLNHSGPLVMLSPANTYPGLTKPGFGEGEPGIFYPTRVQNFARLMPADDLQGAAAARFVHDTLKANTVYLLDDQQTDGKGITAVFENSAAAIGLKVVGHDGTGVYSPLTGTYKNGTDYKALMTKIATSNNGAPPDAIFAGVAVDSNAAQLLHDKLAILGDNRGVKFVGSSGLETQGLITEAGADVVEGVYAAVPGRPYDQLPPAGQQFKQAYDAKYGGDLNEPLAVYGYEAMNVLVAALESVCASGGDPSDRSVVTRAVLATRNFDGALGAWSFDAYGDTSLTGITFYQVTGGKFVPVGQ